jgi:hypothetical protein
MMTDQRIGHHFVTEKAPGFPEAFPCRSRPNRAGDLPAVAAALAVQGVSSPLNLAGEAVSRALRDKPRVIPAEAGKVETGGHSAA